MGLARAMNPATEDTVVVGTDVEVNETSFVDPTEVEPFVPLNTPQSDTRYQPSGNTTESFFDEVARVEEVAQSGR